MTSNNADLILYGHLLNSGTRAVIALLKLKGKKAELNFDDGSAAFRDQLATVNPKVQLPVLLDGDFVVREEAAILIYLAQKYDWQDLLGKDITTRARVHQYLNFHDSSTKMYSIRVFIPYLIKEFSYSGLEANFEHNYLLQQAVAGVVESENYRKMSDITAEVVSEQLQGDYCTNGQSYLCADYMTLADIAAYSEIKLVVDSGLISLASYEKLQRWYNTMSEQSCFDGVFGFTEYFKKPLDTNENASSGGSMDELSHVLHKCQRQLASA